MNPSPSRPEATADEQASLWAARLDGSTLSADDRAHLAAWLDAHPDHRALLSEYCQLGSDLESQLPAVAADADLPAASALPAQFRRTRSWVTAGALAAAAAVGMLLWIQPATRAPDRFATAVGQRVERTLADGTQVELNAHTTLVVELTSRERRVRLASGQAFFTVRSDQDRPFIVETPAGAVRVTGTRFDVKYAADAPLEVVVEEGSVQVRDSGASAGPSSRALVAGDRYVGGPQPTVQALSPIQVADTLAWRQGQVVFQGTPLREALAHFSRYHGRSLSASESAADLSVGGRFSIDDLDGFLAALEDIFPVQVSQNLSGAVQVRLRPEP